MLHLRIIINISNENQQNKNIRYITGSQCYSILPLNYLKVNKKLADLATYHSQHLECPLKVLSAACPCTSNKRTRVSSPPATISFPSDRNVAPYTVFGKRVKLFTNSLFSGS